MEKNGFFPQAGKNLPTLVPQILSKTGKQWRNKGSTELHCLFIVAVSIVDAESFIGNIVLRLQNKFSPNPDPALAGF